MESLHNSMIQTAVDDMEMATAKVAKLRNELENLKIVYTRNHDDLTPTQRTAMEAGIKKLEDDLEFAKHDLESIAIHVNGKTAVV